MKKTNDLIQTQSGHHYVYLEQTKSSHLLPTPCLPYWIGEKKPDNSVASQKVQFFKSLQKEKDGCEFISTYSPLKLEKNLANLNHLLIEVTDGCNLACKYCGYGELYGRRMKTLKGGDWCSDKCGSISPPSSQATKDWFDYFYGPI